MNIAFQNKMPIPYDKQPGKPEAELQKLPRLTSAVAECF
jgi:hypothetical protein